MSFSRVLGVTVTVSALAALPAAVHAAGPMFDLVELPAPDPAIPPPSVAYSLIGMNEAGEVLGTYTDLRKSWVPTRTVIWRRDGTVVEVPKLPPYDLCSAAAINDAGRVVGTCSAKVSGGDPATDTVYSAYVFDPDRGVRPLATPYREGQPTGFVPRVVNSRNQVAGAVGSPDQLATGNRRVAVLSPGKGVRVLPSDPASRFPTGLNDNAGQIAVHAIVDGQDETLFKLVPAGAR